MTIELLFLMLIILAAALAVAGSYLLWGLAVALLTASGAVLAFALLLRMGMTPNG